MASAYDRIKASRRKFHESAGLTDQDIANFQQNYVASQDGAQLVADLKTAEQNLINSPATVRDQHKALADYASAIDRVSTFVGLGGQAPGADSAYLQRMQEQYEQAWNNYDSLVKANRQGFGGLGMQTAAGITPGGVQVDDSALTQRLMPGRGLIDFDTMTPTTSNQQAAYNNTLRKQYQNIQSEAGQEAARWSEQTDSAMSELETVQYWQDVVRKLPQGDDARIVSRNQGWMRQAAGATGITSYTDAADLSSQLAAKESQLRAKSGWSGIMRDRNAGRQRTAMAYEYQLDNPDESIEANYYLAMRDQAESDLRHADNFVEGMGDRAAIGDWLRYNSAYGDQLYQDQKNADLLALRTDANLSAIYQGALESTRKANEAGRLLDQAKMEVSDYGGVGAKTEQDVRALAETYGIPVTGGDDSLIAVLEQIYQQQMHTVNTNVARLSAQGYDGERVQQYIEQSLSEQSMDEYTAETRAYAQENPGAASVKSSFANQLSGGGYLSAAPQAFTNAMAGITGNYENYVPIDTNDESFAFTQYVTSVRDEVAKNIVENGGDDFWYNTGMSMLDNVVQMAVGAMTFGAFGASSAAGKGARAVIQAGIQSSAPVTLATMGLGAASQELVSLTEQGVSSDQAYALATVKGALEIVTERIGIDNLVSNIGKQYAGNMLQQIVGMAAKQSAAEGTEEIIAEAGGLFADWLIRQDESEIMQTIEAGRRSGLTEDEALWQAFKQYGMQVLEAGEAGALSGLFFGAMSTVGVAADAISPASTGARIRAEGNEEALGAIATAYGIEYSPNMSDRQVGKTYRAVQKAAGRLQQDLQQGMSMDTYAQEKGYDAKTTRALNRSWDAYHSVYGNDMSSREFAATWNSVKAAGQANMSFADAVAELGETNLSQATLQNAWKAGQRLYNQAQKAAQKVATNAPVAAQENVQQPTESAATLVSEIGEGAPVQTQLVERSSESASNHARELMDERINVNGLSDDVVESFYDEVDSDISTERRGALSMARMLTGVSKNISQVILVDNATTDAEGHVRLMRNGMWDPTNRTITIDINAGVKNVEQQMTFMTRAMSHELTHYIKTTAPKQYEELERFVLREMDKQHNLEALIKAKISDYAAAGVELDRQGAIDELVAEACEQMLERTDVLNKLAQENKTLWEKIKDYIKSTIQKLKNLYKGMKANSPEARMLQGVIDELQRKWDAAFAASLTAETTETTGDTQHSIAGRNAEIANIIALDEAKQMEVDGYSESEIYQQTGWFRGADNMWRFEIDDSTMRYTPERMAQKMVDGAVHLEDVIDHPVLFSAYPRLRDVSVTFTPMKPGAEGVYRRAENRIYLADSNKNSPEATLIHEIQHAIQALEGFAYGASRAYWANIINNGGKIDSKRLRDATAAVRKFEENKANQPVIDARNRLEDAYDKSVRDGNAMYAQMQADGMATKVDTYDDLLNEQSNAGVAYLNSLPIELYMNTAGEQEARNVAERRTMTAEQRKAKMPQTGTKDTVFAEGSSASASEKVDDEFVADYKKAHPRAQYQVNTHTEMDRAYAEALNSGNMDAAQRLVEQAAATAGYWRSRWHETKPESDFHVFNINRADNASADNQTPYGIFTKAHDRTVGLGGKQMRLFVRADRILRFRDRDTMKQQMPEEYKALLRRLEEVDAKYGAEAEEMEDQFFWDIEEWLEAQPNEDELRERIDPAKPFYESIGDAMPQELIDLETRMTVHSEEWHEAENVEILAAKEWLTKWLPANGYDAMELEYDNGAGDRVTDALIVLSEDQVKLADVITRDDDGNIIPLSERFKAGNKDIRYQISRDTASNMDLLMGASMDGLSKAEADHLLRYRDRVNEIRQNQRKIDELKAEELTADINAQIKRLENANSIIYRRVSTAEQTDLMQRIIERERAAGDVEVQRMDNRVADLEDEIDELEQKIRNAKLAGQMGQGRRDAAVLRKTEERLTKRNEKQKQAATEKAAKQKQQAAERAEAQKQKYTDKLKEQRAQAKQAAADARLAGQMEQGRRDAVALQRTVEEYEARLESKRRELRIARESRDKRIAQMQESRIKSVDSRHRTQMRHKIRKVVKDLDTLLLRGTKERNVRDEMKAVVATALEMVNMADTDFGKYMERLEKQALEAKTPAEMLAILKKQQAAEERNSKQQEHLNAVKDAYRNVMKAYGQYDIVMTGGDTVAEYIDAVKDEVGNTPLGEMTEKQLGMVYNMYKMVLHGVRHVNGMIRDEKNRTIYSMGNSVIRELDGKKRKELSAEFIEKVKQFGWNNLKPIFAMEAIGSDTLTELYEKVRGGEDTWARDVAEANAFYEDVAKQHNVEKWDLDKTHRFASRSGKEFSLSLEQIMSLYAYSKRDQAEDHLQKGGFVFDSAIERHKTKTDEDGKERRSIFKYRINTKQAYGIDPITLNDIIATLTDEQRSFVDEMQAYLSDTMGAKGNEVSLDMYGVRLFNEQNYFPLKTANQFLFEQNEVAGEVKLKNSGFSKHTTPHASNPVILSNFTDVWGRHINDMSMYHAFVIPLENFNRVYNYQTLTTDESEPDSVKGTLADIYGDAPVNYIKQLLTDLNGGARVDRTTSVIDWGLSKFKSSAVMASASVVIQQISAVARATAYIDPKYFASRNRANHKDAWNELKTYAPVAIIKEMGRFDVNMGKATSDWITNKKQTGIRRLGELSDEFFSRAPALMDEIGWLRIWSAVKAETAAKTDLKRGTEEFLNYCGRRFTEIVERTQVYDSVLSRSATMRSKDTGMKMATAFMAESLTSMNMLVQAYGNLFRKGYRRAAARTIGAVAASTILNSILVSLVIAARDDDEDETYTEKYFQALSERLKGNAFDLALVNMIPFMRDIISIFQGYDVSRTDMSMAVDFYKAYQTIVSDTAGIEDKVQAVVGEISRLFGLPVKNIWRDAEGILNVVKGVLENDGLWTPDNAWGDIREGIYEGITGNTIGQGEKLYNAYINDDKGAILRLESSYQEAFGEEWYSQIQSDLREYVKELYLEGDLTDEEATDFLVRYAIELSDSVERQHDTGTITDEEYMTMLENEAYWKLKEWRTGAEDSEASTARYADLQAVIESGGDGTAAIEELLEHGETEDEIRSGASGIIAELYKNGEIDATTAEAYLAEYAGITDSKALYTWFTEKDHWVETGESDYGAYGPVWDAIIEGGDVDGAIDAMVDAGWTEIAVAEEIRTRAKEWVLGTATDGYTISTDEARNILSKYGGVDDDDLDDYINAYEFWLNNPDYVDDFSISQANDYLEYGTGIDIDMFLGFREAKSGMVGQKDANGETISGSVKAEAMEYIDAMPITNAQKDQLYLMYWSESRIYEAPWH